MGMYSWYRDHKIETKDMDKLKEVRKKYRDLPGFHDLVDEDLNVNFSAWDDRKLFGYFYEEDEQVLNDLAECITGYAEYDVEGGEAPERIVFQDGKWDTKRAKLSWD